MDGTSDGSQSNDRDVQGDIVDSLGSMSMMQNDNTSSSCPDQSQDIVDHCIPRSNTPLASETVATPYLPPLPRPNPISSSQPLPSNGFSPPGSSQPALQVPYPLNTQEAWEWLKHDDNIKVTSATKLVDDPVNYYPMKSYPRGFCIIVNNMKFENNCRAERHGSEFDAKRIKKVFTDLGFAVTAYSDQSYLDLKNRIHEIKQVPAIRQGKTDALAFVIMTHGISGSFVMSDNIFYDEKEIIDEFNNENCPGLAGKPKMFFIQACRGILNTQGVFVHVDKDGNKMCHTNFPCKGGASSGVMNMSSAADVAPMLAAVQQPPSIHLHTYSDILISHSTRCEYESLRNPAYGSWYISALVIMLCHYAHCEPLSRILNRVAEFVHSCTSDDYKKQECSVSLEGWTKDLFFNPIQHTKKKEPISYHKKLYELYGDAPPEEGDDGQDEADDEEPQDAEGDGGESEGDDDKFEHIAPLEQ